MIRCLFNKENKAVALSDFEDHMVEVDNKKEIVYSLIKETVLKEDPSLSSIQSALPVLFETYVALLRVSDLLSKILFDSVEKKIILLGAEELIIYTAFHKNLQLYQNELKHLHYISLSSVEGNV